jgi:hypothetical protein
MKGCLWGFGSLISLVLFFALLFPVLGMGDEVTSQRHVDNGGAQYVLVFAIVPGVLLVFSIIGSTILLIQKWSAKSKLLRSMEILNIAAPLGGLIMLAVLLSRNTGFSLLELNVITGIIAFLFVAEVVATVYLCFIVLPREDNKNRWFNSS